MPAMDVARVPMGEVEAEIFGSGTRRRERQRVKACVKDEALYLSVSSFFLCGCKGFKINLKIQSVVVTLHKLLMCYE